MLETVHLNIKIKNVHVCCYHVDVTVFQTYINQAMATVQMQTDVNPYDNKSRYFTTIFFKLLNYL